MPDSPHTWQNTLQYFVMDTVPQTSVAATSDSHAFNSSSFPDPSHSTVRSTGKVVNTGGVLSYMVNVADVVVVLPHSSVSGHV